MASRTCRTGSPFESKVNPDSYLQAFPGVESINDPKLYQRQTYDVIRETHRANGKTKAKRIAHNLPVAPSYAGPKTFPDYPSVAGGAVRELKSGGKVFAGQRDDPFFVDLGAIFDAANLREATGNAGEGKDDLSGFSTHAIVLQVPESKVTKDGTAPCPARTPTTPSWASGRRPSAGSIEVTNADFDSNKGSKGRWVQVSRLGNPLVNEVVIPAGDKDKFNRTRPHKDAANYGKYVVEPELAKILNALFDIGAPETDRTDIVQALLQGLPDLNQQTGRPRSRSTR